MCVIDIKWIILEYVKLFILFGTRPWQVNNRQAVGGGVGLRRQLGGGAAGGGGGGGGRQRRHARAARRQVAGRVERRRVAAHVRGRLQEREET